MTNSTHSINQYALFSFLALFLLSSLAVAASVHPLKGLNVSKGCSKCSKAAIAQTDENGVFRFVGVPKGIHSFEIKLEGTRFAGSYCRVISSEYSNATEPNQKSSVKPAQELTLVVEIVKPSGKPIAPMPIDYEIKADIGNLTCYVVMAGQTPHIYKGGIYTGGFSAPKPCN